MKTSIEGYPRIGARRELKFRTEAFFRGEIGERELLDAAREIKLENWRTLKGRGIDSIPSNDFSLYDGMLDAACLIGAIPARYRDAGLSPLGRYFAMARGNAAANLKALPMRKWFNTNYHYIVPELGDDVALSLEGDKPFAEYGEALAARIRTRPFVIGPFTFLKLASYPGNKRSHDFVPAIVSAYRALLDRCARGNGAEGRGGNGLIGEIELGENALVTDLTAEDVALFSELYRGVLSAKGDVSVRLHTSFGDLRDSWGAVMDLPFDGVALDFVEGTENLALIERFGFPTDRELVAGVISGKNVWKCDRDKTLALIERVAALSGCSGKNGRLAIGASCSLLHVPVSAKGERSLDPGLLARLSFAEEKLAELTELAELAEHAQAASRAEPSLRRANPKVPRANYAGMTAAPPHGEPCACETTDLSWRIAALTEEDWTRTPSRAERKAIQRARFGFPPLPTTTIGSFPQTSEVQANRARFRKGEIDRREYDESVRRMIAECVAFQESVGLDVLVHGEFERNDMVEFFGQSLSGFAFTEHGWVQSYGTRCVKPPIIASDVRRTKPLTVELAAYAQSLTEKPVKGMLTGPVTILNWSFPREDIPLAESAFQIALAVREEVLDLERNGIAIIQIDEAALKEKIPLRKADRDKGYLDWAIRAFCLCSSGVRPETQIHTHMCYSDFTDIIPAIDALDADVITFEAARSNLSILDALAMAGFETDVGPGVYDIHSPRVPSVEELTASIGIMLEKLGKSAERYDGLWVNPDCGLKTRGVAETEESLRRLVEAARRARHADRGRA